jgi:hypothetical protein
VKRTIYVALLIAGALVFGAVKMNGHTRDWRDGLPGSVVAVSTGVPSVAKQAVANDTLIADDEVRLTADLRSAPGSVLGPAAAIRDTGVLIEDLNSAAMTEVSRTAELQRALAIPQARSCAHCVSMLSAALGP